MIKKSLIAQSKIVFILVAIFGQAAFGSVRLKDLSRFEGVRANDLVGYGIVAGLAGTGDSRRSHATMQSVMNALQKFGVSVTADDIASRNVAAVIVTGKLPAFAQSGDEIDVSVSSLGDARSLVGGTLLLTPLKAANNKIYALAQGQVSIGGFKYDLNGNMVQKNHPTVGLIPGGGSIERSAASDFVGKDGYVTLLLDDPDFTTASRAKHALTKLLGPGEVVAVNAGKLKVKIPPGADVVDWMTRIENVRLTPDETAKVVINERTGTVVSGGGVTIDDVTISHGNIKVVISTDYTVSQPNSVYKTADGVRSVVVPNTDVQVNEDVAQSVKLPSGATISDLVTSLRQIRTSTRDVITILEAIRAADALHAKLIVQ